MLATLVHLFFLEQLSNRGINVNERELIEHFLPFRACGSFFEPFL